VVGRCPLLIRYSDWKRPTDADYAFRLLDVGPGGVTPAIPDLDARTDVVDVGRRVFTADDADRFESKVGRWSGPEDAVADGGQPYLGVQRTFEERRWTDVVDRDTLETVLRGTSVVMRREDGRTDYVVRDHHTLDVVLYHYATTGALPTGLFHADRHSDWCREHYLMARRPDQAATWWALIEGLKRPDGSPVLAERDVVFTTARPNVAAAGRDVGASTRVPDWMDPADLPWPRALDRLGAVDVDWVSLDLDDFLPLAQWRLTRGLLRDPRLHRAMAVAKVRLFVLSPQFVRGGDRLTDWTIGGARSTLLRLLNATRRLGVP
jgi:hypothetical protein